MRAAALEIQFAKGTVHMGGVTFVRVSFCLFPLCQNTPPSNQEEPGKTLPSVKLDNPNLPGFGTVPTKPMENSHKPLALRELTSNGFGLLYAKRTQFRVVEAATLEGWRCRKPARREAWSPLDRVAQTGAEWD